MVHSMVHGMGHCMVHYIVHSMVHCTVHHMVHDTVHHLVHHMVIIGCQEFVALKLDALLLPERSQPKAPRIPHTPQPPHTATPPPPRAPSIGIPVCNQRHPSLQP